MDFQPKAESKMKESLAKFKNELGGMRTGRANPQILDSVKVEYYDNQVFAVARCCGRGSSFAPICVEECYSFERRDVTVFAHGFLVHELTENGFGGWLVHWICYSSALPATLWYANSSIGRISSTRVLPGSIG